MMRFYPTLKSLKQRLKIQPVNTGRRIINHLGLVSDDIERLYPMQDENGKTIFKSGVEFNFGYYRGQIKDYGKCTSILDRNSQTEDIFIAICRTVAYEDLLSEHPLIRFVDLQTDLALDLTGMAQHYGLDTNYIDITNNFDIASFFATCQYKDGKYEPYYSPDQCGVIYVLNNQAFFDPSSDSRVYYFGWQPLPRPKEQRAAVLKMKKDSDLNKNHLIYKYYFKHSKSQSKRIWEKFNRGETLFPEDAAEQLASECKKLTSFTADQIDRAFERFISWTNGDFSKEHLIEKSKIEIVDKAVLCWGNLIETNPEYWIEKLNKSLSSIRTRAVADHFQC